MGNAPKKTVGTNKFLLIFPISFVFVSTKVFQIYEHLVKIIQ